MRNKRKESFSTSVFSLSILIVVPVIGLLIVNVTSLYSDSSRRIINILGLLLIIIYWLFYHTWYFPFDILISSLET